MQKFQIDSWAGKKVKYISSLFYRKMFQMPRSGRRKIKI